MNPGSLRDKVNFKTPILEKNDLGRFEESGFLTVSRSASISPKGSRSFQRRNLTGIDTDALVTVRASKAIENASEVEIDSQQFKIISKDHSPSRLYYEFLIQKL
jgi:head-tail adaptor